jgi:sigma-B regulation protein RsbU (phosphoserine phosphatase)
VFADGRIGFTVGDVSGKGMRAALLMAKTASLYRCLAKNERAPGRLLGIINEEICDTATRGMFVTMLVGIYDPAAQTVCIANAGHEPPLLHSVDGTFRAFPAQAPPVGISTTVVREGLFPEEQIALGTGTFYVFTDGVTDALTTEGGELGVEGLKTLIERVATMPLPERLDAIAARLAHEPLRDDLTVLAVDGEVGTVWEDVRGEPDEG